jgi:hypothetical protein
MVLCSSRDGVPLYLKNNKFCRLDNLSIPFFEPHLTHDNSRDTVPLNPGSSLKQFQTTAETLKYNLTGWLAW